MTIAILDYGMGNLTSVKNALAHVGAQVTITADAAIVRAASGVVLPGVGAFGEGMAHLKSLGLDTLLRDEIAPSGRPLLGICLGMQLLLDESEEHGRHDGLGIIPGRVRRLAPPAQTPPLRVPHMGWNHVEATGADTLFKGLNQNEAFYFVHSYVAVPDDPAAVAGWTEHGERFASALCSQTGPARVWATQFHPEKSHRAGLALLENWLEEVRSC
jgi:imidazole glycerol-phosphate synthase subunit HisH